MTKYYLPFYKTGWFYLLLLLWGVCYWVMIKGGFNRLNQFNRDQLIPSSSQQFKSENVAHLKANFSTLQFENVRVVLQKNTDTPVFFVGNPSNDFIRLLQSYLMKNPRSGDVIISTDLTSSGASINELNRLFYLKGSNTQWLRNIDQENIHWKTSSDIVYAPLIINNDDSLPLLSFSKEKVLLTFVGEVIRQVSANKSIDIEASWNLTLKNTLSTWPSGFGGNIYESGLELFSQSIPEFLSNDEMYFKEGYQLIIISDKSNSQANKISKIARNLVNKKYIYQSLAVVLTQWLSLISGLLILWLVLKTKRHYQVLILVGYIAILFVIQYLLLTQMQWLEVISTVVVLIVSCAVLQSYQSENKFLFHLAERHQQLLGLALPVFYQSQKLEVIRPFLEETTPNLKLIQKVFDIALQAEANSNNVLSQRLLTWIEASGINHVESKKKLAQIREQIAIEKLSQSGLDQTMVIGSGNNTMTTPPPFNVKQFGRYQVEGVLGKGAMGIVYRGIDPKISRHVAIKTLLLNDGLSSEQDEESLAESKERFFREAETAGNLSHANIVTIYDVGEEGNLGYIAMDLLSGAPLSEFIKPDKCLPPALVYQLMIQITDALEYAHRQNVVHRDIKPANIIYDDELQRVTVTDFGIAYVADQYSTNKSKTRTGVIMGSPYYMSPEQVLGQQVDGRSDIFSLGVTLYQLLCGYLPFEGDSMASVVYQITNSKQASVKKWNTKLPSSATRITNKAMHKDIDKRFQTMHEFKQALISALKREFKKMPIV